MHVDETKKMVDSAIEGLAKALDQGKSERLRMYLSAMGKFWRYSVGNAILIALQRPGSTRVAGFHTWKKLGRSVRKGERGIAILAPIVRREHKAASARTNSESDRNGRNNGEKKTEGESDKRSVVGFRTAHVFDLTQTDGADLPEFASVRGEPGECLKRLQQFVTGSGLKLQYALNLLGAEGMSSGGTIILRSDLSPAEELSVLCHEWAHERLHHDGVKRPKVVKETEAEAVAHVVCVAVGLETNGAARDYVHLYHGDAKLLMASLERIRRVAGCILAAVLPQYNGQRGLRTEAMVSTDSAGLAASESTQRAAA